MICLYTRPDQDQVQFGFLDLDSLKQAGASPVLLLVKEYANSYHRNILKI